MVRRLLAAALSLLLLTGKPAAGETLTGRLVSVPVGDGFAVVTEEGSLLAPAGTYKYVYEITPPSLPAERQLVAVGTPEGERLMAPDGRFVTEAGYSFFAWEDGWIVFCRDEEYGIMQPDGTVVKEGFGSLVYNGEGRFFATLGDPWDDTADPVILVNPADGSREETSLRTDMPIRPAGEGLFALHSAAQRAWGYVDSGGKWAVEPLFSWVGEFSGSLAPAGNGSKVGLIGRTGEWAVNPDYDRILIPEGQEAYALALSGPEASVLSLADGSVLGRYGGVKTAQAGPEGLCALYLPGEVALLDETGAEALRLPDGAGRTAVNLFAEPGCLILIDGEWGEPCQSLWSLSGQERMAEKQEIEWAGAPDRYLVSEFSVETEEYPGYGYTHRREAEGTRRVWLTDGDGEPISGAYDWIEPLTETLLSARAGESWLLLSMEDGRVLLELGG